jgi:single-strand DNA-binding protein
MKDINKAILIGRLGGDPIQRHTKSGIPVTQFSIATTRRTFREDNDSNTESVATEETQWHRIVAWGRQAEVCSQYLKKGNQVYVEGSIRSHTYADKQGQSKLCFEIQAETISFLGSSGSKKPEGEEVPVEIPVAV